MANELYISTDIETDGPVPGLNSMLSFGSAAIDLDKGIVDTFTRNLELMPGATPNPSTMEWWKTNIKGWHEARKEPRDIQGAMQSYVRWLNSFNRPLVFVGFPVTFDFSFIYYYLMKFVGNSPFSFSALDIKTLAMIALDCQYKDATKRNMPDRWFENTGNHTHVALEDAIEQGKIFINIMKEIKK